MSRKYNVRVELDPAPIRRLAVQCPYCGKWFDGYDISENPPTDNDDLDWTLYTCPICEKDFGSNEVFSEVNIEITCDDKKFEECLQKKVTWE